MGTKWEYEILPFPKPELGIAEAKKELNTKGLESWELVSIINHPESKKFHSESKTSLFAVFKRQIA